MSDLVVSPGGSNPSETLARRYERGLQVCQRYEEVVVSAVIGRPTVARSLRYAAAALVVLNGAVHLYLYVREYHRVDIIGPLFLLNAAAAVLIAVVLVAKPQGVFAVAALVFSVLTLGAFVLSRTTGLFGFSESDFDSKALLGTVAEAGAVAVLATWFAATRPKPGETAVIGERLADETIPGAH
jgi:hypothetical protein